MIPFRYITKKILTNEETYLIPNKSKLKKFKAIEMIKVSNIFAIENLYWTENVGNDVSLVWFVDV